MIKCCRYCTPPERHPGCHSDCEDYIREKNKHDSDRREVSLRKKAEHDLNNYEVNEIHKSYKRRGRRG